MTDSSTGGYLLPAPLAPLPANLTFKQFLQQVFVGVSGLPGDLVLPRWQTNPPKQPDLLTNWMALAATVSTPDANAYVGVSLPTYATGTVQLRCNPISGETVTVNGVLITFVTTLTTGNQVLIGTTSITTASNLKIFLSSSILSGIILATYTVLSNVVTITAVLVGSSGNDFTLSSVGRGVLVSGDTLTGGNTNGNITQRHEDIQVDCAFYGPDCWEYSGIVRDGFQIPQNLEGLRSVNMGFVGTSQAMHVPDLIHERWVDRFEMSVFLRREVMRSYPILSLVSVSGFIVAGFANSEKTVNWNVNV